MYLIGLTGGISTGKSTVTRLLRESGITVIDCDEIAHAVCKKGSWGYRRVVKEFGSTVVLQDGGINRELLSQLIFSDAQARKRLNQATHLPVAFEILRQIFIFWLQFKVIVVVDMPLLFETGSFRLMNKSVVVWCDQNQQMDRLIQRDKISRDVALSRISAQMNLNRKLELADMAIDNSGSLPSLREKVEGVVLSLKTEEAARGCLRLLTTPILPGLMITALALLRLLAYI